MPSLLNFRFITLSLLIGLATFGCRTSKFRGDGDSKKSKPLCTEVKSIEGINIAFMIDNSNSNAMTDCPDRKELGQFEGTNTNQYECGSATNREKAVLSTFDFLSGFAPKDKNSLSTMSIASFPTEEEIFTGWEIRSDGWLNIQKDQRTSLESSMAFTRKPLGATPFHAAMKSALSLYSKKSDDKRPKLALLVTDGEPTDEDAKAVRADAKKLKDSGVKIITIFVTGQENREARRERHIKYLKDEGQSQENIDELMGLNGKESLIDAISQKKIEVQDSSQLESVFKDIIKETVDCVD